MLARLPRASAYEAQVHREQRWLPFLRPYLSLQVPEPLGFGQPGRGYPWVWSVYRWIEGDSAASSPPADEPGFAQALGGFLRALHVVPAEGGPGPGPQNFHRGGSLAVYDAQFRLAIKELKGRIAQGLALRAWEAALASRWTSSPVWVHGDIALGNLLVRDGKLSAVIDFGQLCVGDPACDLAIAWTHFLGDNRRAFLERVGVDADTCIRGRAWALWKAVIVASGRVQTHAVEGRSSWQTIEQVLGDAGVEA